MNGFNSMDAMFAYADGYDEGYEKGYDDCRKHLIENICEWLYQRQAVDLEVSDMERFIHDLKNEMKI